MNNAEFNLAEESCSAGSAVSASSALWTWPFSAVYFLRPLYLVCNDSVITPDICNTYGRISIGLKMLEMYIFQYNNFTRGLAKTPNT